MIHTSETRIRIRYADTDQMKMAYHAKYFEYFEQGRSDLLRELGMSYPEVEALGFYLPVSEAHAKYHKPARYDDLIIVRTSLVDMPQVRVRIEYEVRHGETNDLLAEGYTIHGFVNAATGKPARAPEQFTEAIGKASVKVPSLHLSDRKRA
jgi:acyl-CoA thioester hydrolase